MSARAVLHGAIARPATAIHTRHVEMQVSVSQAEWKQLLDFICQQPGYGPFGTNILAYDLRRTDLARLHPRDRLAYCLWGLIGSVRGLRRVTGSNSLEPAVCRPCSRTQAM